MNALIHLDQNGKKVMERRVHEAVMKERADISTRAQYVWALSCSNAAYRRVLFSAWQIISRRCWTSTWSIRPRI